MRQIERSAELRERAERIKEREDRRKANLKKKNGRIEREREARARMGIPSPVKEDVGASQMRLGAFLAVGVGMKTTCEDLQVKPVFKNISDNNGKEDSPATKQRGTPSRSPLQPRSGNGIMKPPPRTTSPEATKRPLATPPACDIGQSSPKTTWNDIKRQLIKPSARLPNQGSCKAQSAGHVISRKPTSLCPPPTPPARPANPQSVNAPSKKPKHAPMPPPVVSPAGPQHQRPTKHPSKHMIKPPSKDPRPPPKTIPMAPPPKIAPMPPPPLPVSRPPFRPPFQHLLKPPYSVPPKPKPQPIIDEWAAFLVSNTQIEREICTPEPAVPSMCNDTSITINPSLFLTQSEPTSTPCPDPSIKASRPSTEDLLAQICTQDLLFEEVDRAPGFDKTEVEEEKEVDFGEDITDDDLESAALVAELSATPKLGGSQRRDEDDKTKTMQTDSFCDDDFDFSTQELRDLVD